MDTVLLFLAQAQVDKAAQKAKAWWQVAVSYVETYWYISVPGGFVLAFVVFIYVAKWKWSQT